MLRSRLFYFLVICLMTLSLAGCSVSADSRTFEGEGFTFTIPAGWQTMAEIWGADTATGQDYKGLGVQVLVMLQYPPREGEGRAFFVAASAPLEAGQTLEARFDQAYQNATPAIENATQQTFEQGGLTGYEITYDRPWGEPWWHFRDIWIEHNEVVYVLSFYASAGSFDSYSETLNQILDSFQFQE
jgi:hypothetical protein